MKQERSAGWARKMPRRQAVGRLSLALGMLAPLIACASAPPAPSSAGGATLVTEVPYESLLRLGDRSRERGDPAGAAVFYRRAHALEPRDPRPLLALGAALRDLRAPAAAVEAYRAVLAADPRNGEALYGLGCALLEANQPQAALPSFEAALALGQEPRVYNGLGIAYDLLGDHPAAQVYYRQGLELAPGDQQIVNNYALSLALAGEHERAIALLAPIATAPEATARQRQNLALVYGLAGRTEEASRLGGMDLDAEAVRRNLGQYEMLRALGDGAIAAGALGTNRS